MHINYNNNKNGKSRNNIHRTKTSSNSKATNGSSNNNNNKKSNMSNNNHVNHVKNHVPKSPKGRDHQIQWRKTSVLINQRTGLSNPLAPNKSSPCARSAIVKSSSTDQAITLPQDCDCQIGLCKSNSYLDEARGHQIDSCARTDTYIAYLQKSTKQQAQAKVVNIWCKNLHIE